MSAMDQHDQAYTYCAYCPKLCRFACPVSEATHTEAHSTWGKMTAAHLVASKKRELDSATARALHACTGCGRCKSFCKHENLVGPALFAAREETVKSGNQPRGAASTLQTFTQAQNPFGPELAALVASWRSDTPVRYPLFPGCSALVKAPQVIEDTIAVSRAFGAPMGVSRVASRCCGYPLYAAGSHDAFRDHARAKPPLAQTVGYHDACKLGRGLGQYDQPRKLLARAVSGTLEAASIRSEGGCSGGGGLLPRTMPEVAVEVARRQAAEVAPQPDVPVVTACPTSKRMFERSGKTSYDLMTLLRRWVES